MVKSYAFRIITENKKTEIKLAKKWVLIAPFYSHFLYNINFDMYANCKLMVGIKDSYMSDFILIPLGFLFAVLNESAY